MSGFACGLLKIHHTVLILCICILTGVCGGLRQMIVHSVHIQKAKVVLLHAMEALGARGCIASTISYP
jgi:hypothetical protein